jgi:hypothetical protein
LVYPAITISSSTTAGLVSVSRECLLYLLKGIHLDLLERLNPSKKGNQEIHKTPQLGHQQTMNFPSTGNSHSYLLIITMSIFLLRQGAVSNAFRLDAPLTHLTLSSVSPEVPVASLSTNNVYPNQSAFLLFSNIRFILLHSCQFFENPTYPLSPSFCHCSCNVHHQVNTNNNNRKRNPISSVLAFGPSGITSNKQGEEEHKP